MRHQGEPHSSHFELISEKVILETWRTHLWKDRVSPVRPMSSMLFLGGYELTIYEKAVPKYAGVYTDQGEIIGVNSIFLTQTDEVRSRGLWVKESHRRLGVGKQLLEWAICESIKCGAQRVWSFPRQDALFAYESVGFSKCSEWQIVDTEFGPNCYAVRYLN